MDLSCSMVAQLVLGYLKRENCLKAHCEFLKASRHLREFSKKKGNMLTRFLGKNLIEIISEYHQVYLIVQLYLEETDFFDQSHYPKEFIKQFHYLLDRKIPSRCSTPNLMSKCPHIETRFDRNQSLSPVLEASTSDVNTTPLENLPGNSKDEPAPSLKHKLSVSSPRENNEVQSDDSESETANSDENTEPNEMAQVAFAHSLLNKQELQEKLAENINEIWNSSKDKIKDGACDDVESAIKAMLDKTESDPAFDSLMGEIIGSVRGSEALPMNTNILNTPSVPVPPPLLQPSIEAQNREAINSIISTSQATNQTNTVPLYPQTEPKTDVLANLALNANSGDIILYDGSFENYMKAGAITPIPQTNNQPRNVMMVPGSQPDGSDPTNVGKPYYLVSNRPFNIAPQPQSHFKMITEQDILTMPTVILCNKENESKSVLSQPPAVPEKKLKTLFPKLPEHNSLSEFITLYKCNDAEDVPEVHPPPKKRPVPRRNNAGASTSKILPTTRGMNVLQDIVTKPVPNTPIIVVDDDSNLPPINNKGIPEVPVIKVIQKNISGKMNAPKGTVEEESVNIAKSEENNEPTTPSTAVEKKKNLSTPRSGNKSHVRALDFKFNSPAKDVLNIKASTSSPTVKKSPVKSKSAKSLFKSPSKKKQMPLKKELVKQKIPTSWDSELRLLASQGPTVKKKPSPKKKKPTKRAPKPRVKPEPKKKSIDLDCCCDLTVDPEPEKIVQSNSIAEVKEDDDDTPSRRTRSKLSKSPTACSSIPGNESFSNPESSENPEDPIVTNSKETKEDILAKSQITLIKYNAKARYYKKCNVENVIRKDIVVTAVKEMQPDVPETTDNLILSPSKCNASKRSMIEIEEFPDQSTFITPEIVRPKLNEPGTARKNIIPILETPDKNVCPKTPSFRSPFNVTGDTSETKTLNANLGDMDLANFQTPKFVDTPSFALTPYMDGQSPHSNRATDYSTSSSYYQPSDTEQNKSLEVYIKEECKRTQSKKVTPLKVDGEDMEIETTQSNVKIHSNEKEQLELVCGEETVDKAIAEKMKSWSKNVIGKKNLNLMKSKNASSESSSEGDSSDSSNSTSSEEGNDTVINTASQDNSATKYSLRTQRTNKSDELSEPPLDNEETINSILNVAEVQPIIVIDNTETDRKAKVLAEMEEKRRRTIEIFKSGKSAATNKPAPRKRAAPKPKKSPLKRAAQPVKRNLRSNSAKKPVSPKMSLTFLMGLESSSDEEKIIEPLQVVETELLCSSNSSTPVQEVNTEKKPPTNFEGTLKTLGHKSENVQSTNETIAQPAATSNEKVNVKSQVKSRKSKNEKVEADNNLVEGILKTLGHKSETIESTNESIAQPAATSKEKESITTATVKSQEKSRESKNEKVEADNNLDALRTLDHKSKTKESTNETIAQRAATSKEKETITTATEKSQEVKSGESKNEKDEADNNLVEGLKKMGINLVKNQKTNLKNTTNMEGEIKCGEKKLSSEKLTPKRKLLKPPPKTDRPQDRQKRKSSTDRKDKEKSKEIQKTSLDCNRDLTSGKRQEEKEETIPEKIKPKIIYDPVDTTAGDQVEFDTCQQSNVIEYVYDENEVHNIVTWDKELFKRTWSVEVFGDVLERNITRPIISESNDNLFQFSPRPKINILDQVTIVSKNARMSPKSPLDALYTEEKIQYNQSNVQHPNSNLEKMGKLNQKRRKSKVDERIKEPRFSQVLAQEQGECNDLTALRHSNLETMSKPNQKKGVTIDNEVKSEEPKSSQVLAQEQAEYDDLMDFAITLSTSKRKGTDLTKDTKRTKPNKQKGLLSNMSNMDVDSFLNQIHNSKP